MRLKAEFSPAPWTTPGFPKMLIRRHIHFKYRKFSNVFRLSHFVVVVVVRDNLCATRKKNNWIAVACGEILSNLSKKRNSVSEISNYCPKNGLKTMFSSWHKQKNHSK